jgi:hypothetical protein
MKNRISVSTTVILLFILPLYKVAFQNAVKMWIARGMTMTIKFLPYPIPSYPKLLAYSDQVFGFKDDTLFIIRPIMGRLDGLLTRVIYI